SLPPLPPSPAPPCLPCVEGRQRAAPHSSEFPPTDAPLQTLHMDVWGPARVRGQGGERYILLVVDNYTRYTTVFPLRTKGEVPAVLIPWIHATRLQLEGRFRTDLPILRLHSDRGGEFSSGLLEAFCQGEGNEQTFTLPASPQQNGVAERRIGLVMEIARTSLIHAAAPHFLWPFAVRYAAHQLNLWPRVSVPETSPTLRWTGAVGDASVFRFYHPTSRRVFPSQDVTFDESVPFYRLFPYRTAPLPPPPLFFTRDLVEHVEVAVDSGPARGFERAEPARAEPERAEPGGAGSGGTATRGAKPGGAETGGAEAGGAETAGGEPGGAETGGVVPGGAESEGPEPGGAAPGGVLTSQQLREWYSRYCRRRSGAVGAGGAIGAGAEGAKPNGVGVAADPRVGAGGAGATGLSGARTGGTGAAGTWGATGAAGAGPAGGAAGAAGGTGATGAAGGAAGTGAGAAGGTGVAGGAASAGPAGGAAGAAGGTGAAGGAERVGAAAGGSGAVSAGSGGTSRLQPYFVPLLQQVLGGLIERREPESRPVSPVSRPASPVHSARTGRRVPRHRPPAVAGTHQMALRPSTAPQRVPLPSPPASSLPTLDDPDSDSLRDASPTVTRLLDTTVTDPSFESAAASALVAELVDFAAHCRLDYAASLVAVSESESVYPPSVGGECALGTDVLEDRQEDLECFAAAAPHLVSMVLAPEGDPDAPDIPTPRSNAEAIAGEYSSQWQSAMDAEMASWKSTGTYVAEVPPPGANIVSGMWIFRVKRPPSSPPVFKARYVARGFSQREGVDFFQTFSPTPKMTTLRVLLHIAAQHDYELHSLDFSTTFLQGSLHEEIWLRRPPGFTGSFPPCTQWSLRRPVYDLRQAPREWHDTLRTTLAALGFAPSTADTSLFLRTDTSLPPFYILVYVDDLIFATTDTEALALVKSELQKRHTCTDMGELRSYLGLQITRDRARRTITLTQSHMVQQVLQRFGFTGHSSGYSSSCEAEIYATAMAAQELRLLTYLLSDSGERPRSPPVLYVDNKATIVLCEEHRLEHRMKHIALRFFLARELQQRSQLRLRYVATRANTADIFTKALQFGDHQRFCTMLGLVPTFPHLL
ncbi:unnamed protein product, partial [Closterium sp. NIES-65]